MLVPQWSILLAFMALGCSAQEFPFRLASHFQQQMILQRSPKRNMIWGYGHPNATIEVGAGHTVYKTYPTKEGIWKVLIYPQDAGPAAIRVNQLNVNPGEIYLYMYYGDVWLCSGGSNMKMTVDEAFNATEEVENILNNRTIQLLQIEKDFSPGVELTEIKDFSIPWSAPAENLVRRFSATCLSFGLRISEMFDYTIPIGLIEATYEDTAIEAWIKPKAFTFCNTPPNQNVDQNSNSAVWNAMIAPLTGVAVRGALWYQGESNVNFNPEFYACHVAMLVQQLREEFIYGDVGPMDEPAFPVGIVQMGPKESGNPYAYGDLRLHQTANEGFLPNRLMPGVFMANTYDLTDRTQDSMIRDKVTVAERLADAAWAVVYGDGGKQYGPKPVGASFVSPTEFVVGFDVRVKSVGDQGFVYEDDWGTSHAAILKVEYATVHVYVPLEAKRLSYAFKGTVCEYKDCAIYTYDPPYLPAQPWQWDLTKLRELA